MARSPNKFFNCFRPNCTVEPEDVAAPSDGNRRENPRARRSPRPVAKALLFHASLVKKIRRIKSQDKSYTSKCNKILSKFKRRAPQSATESPTNDLLMDSYHSIHCSSPNSSSSTISSTPFSSSSGSSIISTISLRQNEAFEYKQTKRPSCRKMLMGIKRDLNFGLCLFVVCLLILMCWGKVWAIFCTSALFVLVPSRARRANSVGHGRVHPRQMDLMEHKKSIIMEGLLARNRNRICSY